MTHLLVVTTNFAEARGGVEGHLTSLLPLLVDRDIDVTVAYLGDAERRLRLADEAVRRAEE